MMIIEKIQTGVSIVAVAGLFFLTGGEVKAQTVSPTSCASNNDCTMACPDKTAGYCDEIAHTCICSEGSPTKKTM